MTFYNFQDYIRAWKTGFDGLAPKYESLMEGIRSEYDADFGVLETIRNVIIVLLILGVSGFVIRKYISYKWGQYRITRGIEKAEQRALKQEEDIYKIMGKREQMKEKYKK